MKTLTQLPEKELKEFDPEAKIGLIASVSPEGLPHITMISSIRAKSPTQLMWGQFTAGMSKKNVQQNPKVGWLVLTMDKKLYRGKATWTHLAKSGEDFNLYNNTPMFRYNAYFGINTVHYMDLVETYGREKLPMAKIVLSSILTSAVRSGAKRGGNGRIMKPWAEGVFNSMGALKFISYIGPDGYPVVAPLLQCQAPDSRSLVFTTGAYKQDLMELRPGQKAAVFGLTMEMEDVLVRGDFAGYGRTRGIQTGRIDIDYVYNSMPPKQGQIYPMPELRPVVNF